MAITRIEQISDGRCIIREPEHFMVLANALQLREELGRI